MLLLGFITIILGFKKKKKFSFFVTSSLTALNRAVYLGKILIRSCPVASLWGSLMGLLMGRSSVCS